MAKYIYNNSNWTHFTWDDQAINAVFGELKLLQGNIISQMNLLGFSAKTEAKLGALTLDVVKSSEIEGELLNYNQVRSSIARRLGINIAGLVESNRQIEGVVEMMLDATQRFEQKLTHKRLFGWHAALFPTGYSGPYAIEVGKYRTGEMQVVSGAMGHEKIHYEAVDAKKVKSEMTRFLDWLNNNNQLDPVMKAAIAHFWFIIIHPFDDGNGRIARAITDMLLARADKSSKRFYSMSTQIQAERNVYYEILERTQKGNLDITAWLKWFLDCLMRSMEQTDETIKKTMTRAQFWEANKETPFNARQQKILHLLLADFFGVLRVSKYAKIVKTSTDTALRDLQDLVKKNILEQKGSGRSTFYILK